MICIGEDDEPINTATLPHQRIRSNVLNRRVSKAIQTVLLFLLCEITSILFLIQDVLGFVPEFVL